MQQTFSFARPECPSLDLEPASSPCPLTLEEFQQKLRSCQEFGRETIEATLESIAGPIPVFVNEFWTARQRAAHSLHEVSYRACFKPQLPRFFIQALTRPGARIYDPFMGRGTTLLEAGLLGRAVAGNDINPLSCMLVRPRLNPPRLQEIAARLDAIDFAAQSLSSLPGQEEEDLLVFYHPDTLRQILALRHYLAQRASAGELDAVDEWIRMVAINRLSGHSSGFFSVYTMPPNQAVSAASQRKINARRQQVPESRLVPAILLKKSRQLLADLTDLDRARLAEACDSLALSIAPAANTVEIATGSVDLVVTSPPFLDVVQYANDNWLRCWFAGIDSDQVEITMARRVDVWQDAMRAVFRELHRVLAPGGKIAFEVGEVRGGQVRLEETVVEAVVAEGFRPVFVLVNQQDFTKTSNCWGVANGSLGTNSNRVVVIERALTQCADDGGKLV